jgi:predicted tellurium resistance membrane protein TerC
MSATELEPEDGPQGLKPSPEQERKSARLLGIILVVVFALMAALVGVELMRAR